MMTSRRSKTPHRYEIEFSPLYRLSNKKKLAALLNVDVSIISSPDKSKLCSQYRIFVDKKTKRFITEPIGDLLAIHQRLLKFFSRIAPPEYIHSAIKKRSYLTNAEAHRKSSNILKIDIKKFFPSIKFQCIYGFFLNTLKCSSDIATILAKICTVQTNNYGTHLPTGSCISPILSFLANQQLFDSIKIICEKEKCKLTLYVDDITISGENASPALLTLIAMEIFKHGYGYHKIKIYKDQPAIITGLVVYNKKVCLPHERAKKIRELIDALKISVGPLRQKMLASLVGRLSEAEHIESQYKAKRVSIISQYRKEWDEVVANRNSKCKVSRNKKLAKNNT
ncbi:reverse transcriptase family protein [Methylomicrobium sp. RS1]|uniref:reverse transcriptase family protein n=1 Tax=Candidatus Methylomicrobium oryzae TaxID=2802053 RepID=UPI0019209E57|nr:reverse transcriptase family protein [Methylomicrobium sp. RS1]MBL1263879.1 RNA-directed DNA polymerase [Methylomicrobium sp. RS1]